jgi:hypothetical protein
LVRFGARDYDALSGRWTAKEPLGFGGGNAELYSYAFADPVGWIDPAGTIPLIIGAAVSAGAFEAGLNIALQLWLNGCVDWGEVAVKAAAGAAVGAAGYGLIAGLRAARAARAGSYLARKAPKQVTPGTRVLGGQYVDDLGRVQPWRAHYDDYGRLVGRTDFNAANRAAGIADTHYHRFEYNAQFPLGREIQRHIPGIFPGG